MKTAATTFLLLFTTFAGAAPSLIGEWKSNKELTLDTISFPDHIDSDLKQRFNNHFGVMTVRYTEDKCIAYTPETENEEEWSSRSRYQILAETKNKVLIRGEDVETGEKGEYTIHFVSDNRYWISLYRDEYKLDYLKDSREYFDRIEPEPSDE